MRFTNRTYILINDPTENIFGGQVEIKFEMSGVCKIKSHLPLLGKWKVIGENLLLNIGGHSYEFKITKTYDDTYDLTLDSTVYSIKEKGMKLPGMILKD